MSKERLPLNTVCLPLRNVCLSISTLQVQITWRKWNPMKSLLNSLNINKLTNQRQDIGYFAWTHIWEGFALQLLMFHTLLLLHPSPNHITWHARNPMQRQESKSQILLFSPCDSGVSTFKMLRFSLASVYSCKAVFFRPTCTARHSVPWE